MSLVRRRSAPAPRRRVGTGQPVLLLHGFGSAWPCWGQVIDDLAADHDVLAPTLAGHWGAQPLRRPATVATLADLVESEMDSAGWSHAHIAGNSLGGWLALELAARGRAYSVTAIAPAGIWRSHSRAAARLVRRMRRLNSLAGIGRFASYPGIGSLLRFALLRKTCRRPALVDRDLAALVLEAPAHFSGAREFLANVAPTDNAFDVIDSIDVPVTVVFAEHDRIVPPRHYGLRLLTGGDLAHVVVLPDVGHVPMLDASRPVAQEIRRTVASARERARVPRWLSVSVEN